MNRNKMEIILSKEINQRPAGGQPSVTPGEISSLRKPRMKKGKG